MSSPFKFLDPYGKDDRKIFFGRDEEIEFLYNTSFSTDLILVYGQTGTGKTSLIRCGLANRFDKTDWFEVYIRRNQNINDTLFSKIKEKVKKPLEKNASLTDAVHSLYLDYLKPVYLIFDQFEELFTLRDNKNEQTKFFEGISQLLNSGLSCKIIIVLREEYLSKLHNYERIVPELFDNRVLIEQMYTMKLEKVIRGSLKAFNIQLDQQSPDEAVNRIIENNKVKEVVHLTYLQVYLDRLYRESKKSNPDTVSFTLELIEAKQMKLKDVMATFLDEQTDHIQQDLINKFPGAPQKAVWNILNQFATVEGTAHPVPEENILSKYTGKHEIAQFCLDHLEESRILRRSEDGNIFEIAHDTLAERINDKRTDQEKQMLAITKLVKDRLSIHPYLDSEILLSKKELKLIDDYYGSYGKELVPELETREMELIKRSKLRARIVKNFRLFLAGVSSVILFLLFFSYINWQNALMEKETNKKTSEALRLVTIARSEVERNPTAAVRLAQEAQKIKKLDIAEDTLSKIYNENLFYKIAGKTAGDITSSMFSQDGKIFLTATKNKIRVMDRQDINIPPPQPVPTGGYSIKSIALSSQGDKILIGSSISNEGRVYLQVIKGPRQQKPKLIYRNDSPGISIEALAFSGSSKKISIGTSAGAIYLKNLVGSDETRELYRINGSYVKSLAFSGDDRYIFAGYNTGAMVLIDLNSNRKRFFNSGNSPAPGQHHALVRGTFSPRGDYFLSGSDDGIACLWSITSDEPKLIQPFEGIGKKIKKVYFSPDSKYFFIASWDIHVYLLELPEYRFAVLKGHTGYIQALTYSPDSQVITSVSSDRTIREWKMNGGIFKIIKQDNIVRAAAFSEDQKSILLGFDNGQVKLAYLNRKYGKYIETFSRPGNSAVCSLIFTPGTIFAGTINGSIYSFDRQGRSIPGKSSIPTRIDGLALSPDLRHVLTWSSSKTAGLWIKSRGGDFEKKLDLDFKKFKKTHQDWISAIVYAPDGGHILTGSYDKTAILWRFDHSKLEYGQAFKGHESRILSLAFSPDGRFVLTGSLDKTARLWDVKKGEMLQLFKGFNSAVTSVAFSNDYILTAIESGYILIWERKESLGSFLNEGNVEPLTKKQKQDYYIDN